MPDSSTPDPQHISALVHDADREPLHEALAPLQEAIAALHKAIAAPTDGLLTFNDAAAWLAVSPRTLESIVADGDLAPIAVRGQRRFTRDQLHAYIHRAARAPRRVKGRAAR